MKIKLLRNVIKRQNIFLELYVSIRNKFLCPYCFMDYKIVILCIFALSFKLIFPFMSIRFIIFFRWSVAYRLVHKSHACIYIIYEIFLGKVFVISLFVISHFFSISFWWWLKSHFLFPFFNPLFSIHFSDLVGLVT